MLGKNGIRGRKSGFVFLVKKEVCMFHIVVLKIAAGWQFIKHSTNALKGILNYTELQRSEAFEQGFDLIDLADDKGNPKHAMKESVDALPYQAANAILFGYSAYRMATAATLSIDPVDAMIGCAAIAKTAHDAYQSYYSPKKKR